MTRPFHRRPTSLSLPSQRRVLQQSLLQSPKALQLTPVSPPTPPFRRCLHLRLRFHASQLSRSLPRKLRMSLIRANAMTRPTTTFSQTKIWLIVSSPRQDSYRPGRRLERSKIQCSTPPRSRLYLVRCLLRTQPGYRNTRMCHNMHSQAKLTRSLATCMGPSHLLRDLQSRPRDMVPIARSCQPICSLYMGSVPVCSRDFHLSSRNSNTSCKLLIQALEARTHHLQATARRLQPKACRQPRVASLPHQRDSSWALAWSRCWECPT